jgi:hypothetical protein
MKGSKKREIPNKQTNTKCKRTSYHPTFLGFEVFRVTGLILIFLL